MPDSTLMIVYIVMIIYDTILAIFCEIHDCIHAKMNFRFHRIFGIFTLSLIPLLNFMVTIILSLVFMDMYIKPRYLSLEDKITAYLQSKGSK